MKKIPCSLIMAATLFVAFSSHAAVKIDEQVIGPVTAGGVYAVSPSGVRVAYINTKGSRLVVAVDGVEGPVMDDLFTPRGQSFYSPPRVSPMTASAGGRSNIAAQRGPVIMSPDGKHYAYAGRQGNEYVVIHDGKEIARGPRPALALNYGQLTLSPGGNHVHWNEQEKQGGRTLQRLVMDGKPGPWSGHQDMLPVFSSDDSRYAYTAVSPEDKDKYFLVVDGKVADYIGMEPMFTADGKLLLTIGTIDYKRKLQVNGKVVSSGQGVGKVVTAPVGNRYAAIDLARVENGKGVPMLYLDGREVPGTEGAQQVWFSPDGKRYAVACVNDVARSAFMVVDGRKGQEYQTLSINEPYWTPDSSKLIYTAASGGRNFLIVENQEFPITSLIGGLMESPIAMAAQGNRYAFGTRDGSNRVFSVVVDGQSVLPPNLSPNDGSLTFSADGSRFVYVVGPVGRNEVTGLVVDGKLNEALTPLEFHQWARPLPSKWYLLSDDGKHLAQVAGTGDRSTVGLYVDGTLVYPSPRSIGSPEFTPDSRHLFWLASEAGDKPGQYLTVYADGEPTVKFAANDFMRTPGWWEMGGDGVLTFLAVDGDVVKRYRITPSSEMTVARLVTEAEANRTKAAADAQAQQKAAVETAATDSKKAAEEAAAAKLKAQEEAAAAAAKRQADYAAAVAAKQKARADAMEAKRQARLLYLENVKRKKLGLPPLKELP